MFKLNVGCGDLTPDGWENIDICWNARISQLKIPGLKPLLRLVGVMPKTAYAVKYNTSVKIVDVAKKGLPYADGSADVVYSALFLDHLGEGAANRYFDEVRRVLRPGGIVRTLVADVYDMLRKYVEESQKMLAGPTAERNGSALDHIEEALIREYLPEKGVRWYHFHRSMWDENKMCGVLAKRGFVEIERKPFRESRLEDIELVERQKGHLIVEAVKPAK